MRAELRTDWLDPQSVLRYVSIQRRHGETEQLRTYEAWANARMHHSPGHVKALFTQLAKSQRVHVAMLWNRMYRKEFQHLCIFYFRASVSVLNKSKKTSRLEKGEESKTYPRFFVDSLPKSSLCRNCVRVADDEKRLMSGLVTRTPIQSKKQLKELKKAVQQIALIPFHCAVDPETKFVKRIEQFEDCRKIGETFLVKPDFQFTPNS